MSSPWARTSLRVACRDSPGRRSVVRRFLVTCLGDADEIFRHLYAQLRELGWVGPSHGRSDPPGWNRMDLESGQYVCAPLRDPGLLACAGACLDICASALRRRFCASDAWVHQMAEDLRSGKVEDVIGRVKRLRPRTAELRDSLQALIRYYSENDGRMRYDESVQRMTQAYPRRAKCRPDAAHAGCIGIHHASVPR